MKWNRFTLKTKTEAEDIVICTLAEVGIEGVEIQDKQPLTDEDKAQMFVDIMPEGPADDGIAYLNFYLEEDADTEAILKDVKEALEDYEYPVEIRVIKERPFFHFKTNRKELTAAILEEKKANKKDTSVA